MSVYTNLRAAVAAASLLAGFMLAGSAAAQTVGSRITVGATPKGIAVNPVTGKVYVANAGSDTVSVISGSTLAVTTTITLPAPASGTNYPEWIAVNPETNTVYVSNLLSANTMVIDGATDTHTATLLSGGGGWTAVNPLNDTVYVIRYGGADEVNTIQHDLYKLTSAFRSDQPVGLALNITNNRLYVGTRSPGDIAAMDMSIQTPYPPLLCPDGSGGFRAQPADPPMPPAPDPYNLPCIDVPNPPVSIAVNPVTNTIYALSDSATGPISVIAGSNHTHTSLTPSGGLTGARTIAVDPVRNVIYATFSNAVVRIDGATSAMTTISSGSGAGGPVAIGINVLTGVAYVPNADGTMLVIRANGATQTLNIPTGANAIAVNPLDNRVWVLDAAGGVTPVTDIAATPVANGITTSISALPSNTSRSGGTITLNASSSMVPPPLNTVRKVYFRIGTTGPWTEASGSGPWTAIYAGLSQGTHTIYAFATNGLEAPSANTDLASVPVVGNVASYTFNVTSVAAPEAVLSPSSFDFGAQSMGTTSDAQTLTITNIGSGNLTISGVSTTAQFGQTNNCATLAEGQTCTVNVTFTPAAAGGAINTTVAVSGTLSIASNGTGSPNTASLSGTAEKSLVTHYYRSILRRAPDTGGKAFWSNEAARLVNLGANVNEAWFAMAMSFYTSAEYQALARDNAGYVTDLYKTFFNRAPDSAGMAHWTDQLVRGLPREVLLATFMFSPEFTGFSQGIFGNTAVRAEIDVVGDFYRGLLGRLPDDGGFAHWLQQFRTAQCQGSSAVYAQVDSISSLFIGSSEYSARGRTNAQFIGDLYNAFLRRGGDREGVQFWIDQLQTQNREQVRRAFFASPEFSARVNAVVAQGCMQ